MVQKLFNFEIFHKGSPSDIYGHKVYVICPRILFSTNVIEPSYTGLKWLQPLGLKPGYTFVFQKLFNFEIVHTCSPSDIYGHNVYVICLRILFSPNVIQPSNRGSKWLQTLGLTTCFAIMV